MELVDLLNQHIQNDQFNTTADLEGPSTDALRRWLMKRSHPKESNLP